MALRLVTSTNSLSKRFSLSDLCFSDVAERSGFANYPDALAQSALAHLCEQGLEPLCDLLGSRNRIRILSGYRSYEINKMMHGDPISAHLRGEAVDLLVDGANPIDIAMLIRGSNMVFDKLTLEYHRQGVATSGWVHLECRAAKARCLVSSIVVTRHGITRKEGLPNDSRRTNSEP